GDRGGGHAVLAGAGLGDDPGLAHAAGQQRLADGVVHLVRAGVVQVLSLEQDPRTAGLAAQAPGEVHRAGAADVVRQVLVERGDEGRIGARGVVGGGELAQRLDERLGDEAPAVPAEVAAGVGPCMEVHGTVPVVVLLRCYCGAASTWQSARCTSSTKRRRRSPSLIPGADSTPLETSTPQGSAVVTASNTLPGFSPPASIAGWVRSCGSSAQSNARPLPPGSPRRLPSKMKPAAPGNCRYRSIAVGAGAPPPIGTTFR